MKGIVFTEYLEMVAQAYGEDVVDDMIDSCDLLSGGAYTSVGLYDHNELIQMITALSRQKNIPAADLVQKFGYYLFFRFHEIMPVFFEKHTSAFAFLETIDDYIHVEVKKLYPDAQLPRFSIRIPEKNTLILTYESRCPFADLAQGLVHGCLDFYKEIAQVTTEDRNSKGEFSRVFTIVRTP